MDYGMTHFALAIHTIYIQYIPSEKLVNTFTLITYYAPQTLKQTREVHKNGQNGTKSDKVDNMYEYYSRRFIDLGKSCTQ